jgi:hypothetical protein
MTPTYDITYVQKYLNFAIKYLLIDVAQNLVVLLLVVIIALLVVAVVILYFKTPSSSTGASNNYPSQSQNQSKTSPNGTSFNTGLNTTYRVVTKTYYPSGLTQQNITTFKYILSGNNSRIDIGNPSSYNYTNLSYFKLSNQLYACYTTKSGAQTCLRNSTNENLSTKLLFFVGSSFIVVRVEGNATFNATLNATYYKQLSNQRLIYSEGYPCYLIQMNVTTSSGPNQFTQCVSTQYHVPIFTDLKTSSMEQNSSIISVNNNAPASYFKLPYTVSQPRPTG